MNVLIIGPHTPLIGGISTHNQRFAQWLLAQGVETQVLDLHYNGTEKQDDTVIDLPRGMVRRLLAIIKIAQQTSSDTLVHFHVAVLNKFKWVAPFLLWLFRKNPKVLTLHAGELTWQRMGFVTNAYTRWVFKHFRKLVAVNTEIEDYLTKNLNVPQKKIVVIPAFIRQPPNPDLIPNKISQLVGKKILVVTSGALQNIYRHDTMIDCIEKLAPAKYAFIFAFYSRSESEYAQRIKARLATLDNVIVFHNLAPEVYVSIVSVCDIYVRTTITDGDSLAVREAEDLGLTIFASDNVWRPPSCKLFSLNDAATLLELFREYEQQSPVSRQEIAPSEELSNADRLFGVYKKITHNVID